MLDVMVLLSFVSIAFFYTLAFRMFVSEHRFPNVANGLLSVGAGCLFFFTYYEYSSCNHYYFVLFEIIVALVMISYGIANFVYSRQASKKSASS